MRLRTKGDLLGGAPVWLCFCLGAYWAWASCAFFGTMAVPFADDPKASSEVVHIVALAVCCAPFCSPSSFPVRRGRPRLRRRARRFSVSQSSGAVVCRR